MKKIAVFAVFIFCFFILKTVTAAADVFNYPATAKNAAAQMPEFESTKCKFKQNKYMIASKINLVSGGNFQFVKDEGVSFETTYPIHSETSYTTSNNKNINAIVKAIINKNFSYIEKNFEIYYMKRNLLYETRNFKLDFGTQAKSQQSVDKRYEIFNHNRRDKKYQRYNNKDCNFNGK